jgi:hypothetical protein
LSLRCNSGAHSRLKSCAASVKDLYQQLHTPKDNLWAECRKFPKEHVVQAGEVIEEVEAEGVSDLVDVAVALGVDRRDKRLLGEQEDFENLVG